MRFSDVRDSLYTTLSILESEEEKEIIICRYLWALEDAEERSRAVFEIISNKISVPEYFIEDACYEAKRSDSYLGEDYEELGVILSELKYRDLANEMYELAKSRYCSDESLLVYINKARVDIKKGMDEKSAYKDAFENTKKLIDEEGMNVLDNEIEITELKEFAEKNGYLEEFKELLGIIVEVYEENEKDSSELRKMLEEIQALTSSL